MSCRVRTRKHQKLQTGQNSAQRNKAHVCASPVSNQRVQLTQLPFYTINYPHKLDEKASHERLNFRSLAWFTAQTVLSVVRKDRVSLIFCRPRCLTATSSPKRLFDRLPLFSQSRSELHHLRPALNCRTVSSLFSLYLGSSLLSSSTALNPGCVGNLLMIGRC